MKLTGRILYLSDDASLLNDQLEGKVLSAVPDLHYGVNTDAMISGKACTFGYTPRFSDHTFGKFQKRRLPLRMFEKVVFR